MGSDGDEEARATANAELDAEVEAEVEAEVDVVELDTRGTLRLSLLGDLDELPWPQRIAKSLNKHYFSLACIAAIVAAAAYPRGGHTDGPIQPEVTSAVVAVILILFITGITLPTLEIKHALMRWKVNGYSQFVNIVFFPVFVFLVALALRTTPFDSRLLDGTIILACIPTTVSMSVVMTKTAAGNEAVALCNASAGNVLGVFLTPAWLLGLANAKTTVPFGETILNLTYKVCVSDTAHCVVDVQFSLLTDVRVAVCVRAPQTGPDSVDRRAGAEAYAEGDIRHAAVHQNVPGILQAQQ